MSPDRILIVDDEPEMLGACRDILARTGAEVVTEGSAARAVERLESERFDLAVIDIRIGNEDGLEVLRRARAAHPDLAALLMTAFPSDETVERSVKFGAVGYVTKPFTPEQLRTAALRALVDRCLRSVPEAAAHVISYAGMIGGCQAMRRTFALIEKVGPAEVDVLLTGESGTGKELVARALHARGPRARGRYVPVDCGAIPESLLESELFGHEKGAFTGAVTSSRGLVEFAHGGTLFLDEIAELPLSLQVKILRVVQERQLKRVGGSEFLDVDVRIVAATHRDIDREVREGRFREDLFYRLNVVRIEIPPLRDRGEDITALFDAFLRSEGQRFGRVITGVDPEVRRAVEEYPWPGNVREMLNMVRRILALGQGERIEFRDLPPAISAQGAGGASHGFFGRRMRVVRSFEQSYLSELLARHSGDVTAAAKEAEMPRGTFYRLMKKYGLRAQGRNP